MCKLCGPPVDYINYISLRTWNRRTIPDVYPKCGLIKVQKCFGSKSEVNPPRLGLRWFVLNIALWASTLQLTARTKAFATVNTRSLSCSAPLSGAPTDMVSRHSHYPALTCAKMETSDDMLLTKSVRICLQYLCLRRRRNIIVDAEDFFGH